MFTHVRWYWPEDDCWNYEELDADRWPVRHVEVRRSDSVPIAAASLVEVQMARDSDNLEIVRRYEQRYSILPAGPFPFQTTPADQRRDGRGRRLADAKIAWPYGADRAWPVESLVEVVAGERHSGVVMARCTTRWPTVTPMRSGWRD